jgi:hypothetical protein
LGDYGKVLGGIATTHNLIFSEVNRMKGITVRYNDPDFLPISDNWAVYKGKDYITLEDLKLFPDTVTLVDSGF